MVQRYTYRVVDVFTEQVLEGNSLAVFTDASGMEPATMQRIARELNLAETTFVLPATRNDCVARVRIFAPGKELAFCAQVLGLNANNLLDIKPQLLSAGVTATMNLAPYKRVDVPCCL